MLSLRVPRIAGDPRGYVGAVVVVLVAIGASMVFQRLPSTNLSLLFLLVVLITAARWGLGPSILASLLSFLALNFFFTPPAYTFGVAEEADVATLFFFLAAAALTGRLAAKIRAEAAASRAALGRVSALLDFSRRMTAAQSARQVLEALVERLAVTFSASTVALTPCGERSLRPEARRVVGKGPPFDLESAEGAWRDSGGRAVHAGGWTYLPLAAGSDPIALAAIGTSEMWHESRQLADALCEQASIAVARTMLVDDLRKAQLESETERLRSALLSSVSHDLRTPLASIIGSATSLLEYGDAIRPDDGRELLHTIRDESERLDRYVQNLLEMTRFGQGDFVPTREWVDLNDLAGAAVRRLRAVLSGFRLNLRVVPDAALIFVQGALIEQVLVNLLENAASFSTRGAEISIVARAEGDAIALEVIDNGPGIGSADREKVFDLFYRAEHGDGRPGAGLGLAICRSIVKSHGGSIEAVPNPAGGTRMRVVLPRAEQPVLVRDGQA